MAGSFYPLAFIIDPYGIFTCFSFWEIECRKRGIAGSRFDLVSDEEIAGHIDWLFEGYK